MYIYIYIYIIMLSLFIAYITDIKLQLTATSTTGHCFRLARVSEMSVLSSISTLFCRLEVTPSPKLDLLVSIGVTLINKSLFLCFCFQIWSADPPWSFNWTNVSWINQPLWNSSDAAGDDGEEEREIVLLDPMLYEDLRNGINPNLAWYFPSQQSFIRKKWRLTNTIFILWITNF